MIFPCMEDDEYWTAALFEEIDGKRSICGYKSGASLNLQLLLGHVKPFLSISMLSKFVVNSDW